MGPARWVFLAVVIVLLTLSVILAQVVFRVDRTVLTYRFTSGALQTMLDPLEDPEIHTATMTEAFRDLCRAVSLSIPADMHPLFIDAALAAFLAAGVPSLVVVYLRADEMAADARMAAARAMPPWFSWTLPGLEETVSTFLKTGRTTAVLVTLYGVLAVVVGAYLVFAKGDPRIELRPR